MSDGISGRDLDALRELLALPASDPGPALPWELLECLRGLFHTDYLEYSRSRPSQELFVLEQSVGERREVLDEGQQDPHYWELYPLTAAATYPDRGGDLVQVTKLSDFCSDRELRASPMYVDYCGPGMFRALSMYFPAEPGYSSRLMLWRGPGRDFDERDRLLLTLLRPHLIAAYRTAERRRQAPAPLTPRQLEVLRYVAQGCTNTQIARRMHLSEGTVRTHLNHVYERLGVTSRTAAITRMTSAGMD
jgi:DNA-binding CsgD family transcriptional regulator